MAGQEKQGDLWGLPLRLDLLPLIVRAGFKTLSLASVQNLGSRYLHLPKISSRSRMNPSMLNHESEKRFCFFKMTKQRLGWVNMAV
jgi:hypothetical protein